MDGLTITDLRRLAFEYASSNNIENRFDKSAKMAGRERHYRRINRIKIM